MRWRPRAVVFCTVAAALIGFGCGGDDGGATTTPAPDSSTTSALLWPTEPTTEEVTFTSGEFELVGDLVLPGGEGPYPAVIAVHGSGQHLRASIPGYWPLRNAAGDAGFAFLSWDTPGSGESKGVVEFPITQRSVIVADAVAFLTSRPEIDPERVGLWGLSQGGWVMPKALEETDDVAFMISVSGGAEDAIEQTAYRVGRQLVCLGGAPDDGDLVEEQGARALKAATYAEYRTAAELVYDVPDIQLVYPFEISDEADWSPAPRDIESWFDPMSVVRDLTIPVLAVYGELDTSVDPVQGTDAYSATFADGGHELSTVELIPGVGHTMLEATTGCSGDTGGAISARYIELMNEWLSLLATEL